MRSSTTRSTRGFGRGGRRWFDETLELLGVSFHVTSPNVGDGNGVRVAPAGLEIENQVVEWPVEGVVTGAEVADLNVDVSPEIYVYVVGPGEEARGSSRACSPAASRSSTSAASVRAGCDGSSTSSSLAAAHGTDRRVLKGESTRGTHRA
jgi:hypothetical protein